MGMSFFMDLYWNTEESVRATMLTVFLMVIIKIFIVNDEHDICTVILRNALDPSGKTCC